MFEHVKHCNAVIRSIPNFRRKPIDQSALESHFGSRRVGVGASKSRRARESKIKGKADSACVSTILHRRCHVRDANKFTYQSVLSIAESDWNGMSPSLDICRIIMPFSFRAAIRSIQFVPACFNPWGQNSRRSFISGLSVQTRWLRASSVLPAARGAQTVRTRCLMPESITHARYPYLKLGWLALSRQRD